MSAGKRPWILESDKIETLRIGSVAELKENGSKAFFSENAIDGVIHCMAVSDYTVANVTTPRRWRKLSWEVYQLFDAGGPDRVGKTCRDDPQELLCRERPRETGGKYSSDMEQLVITMVKTPKIIGMIKKLQPENRSGGLQALNHVSVTGTD
jgi:phosphopantothenate-cysteine ligase